MWTTDPKDLLKAVELLRKELHPDLSADFLEAVVRAEEESPEDDAEAIRAIQAALKTLLIAKGAV
jgi:ABC-type nitrate/sulfonate/bicarbonate transport system substrate-binding protein